MNTLGRFEINQIYSGDCALLMAELPPDCIDLTVTSPPYDNLREYNGYTFDFESVAYELFRVTKPGGVVVWVVADATVNGSETGTSFRQALHFMELGFNLHDTMIYQVPGTGAKGSNLAYWQAFEFMFVFSKGVPSSLNLIHDHKNVTAGSKKNNNNAKYKTRLGQYKTGKFSKRMNVWKYAVGNNGTEHPAPFPEALARDHILSWSNPGYLVFDPMCGSGTTCKMAKQNGRQFLGFDISAEYCEIARKRISAAQTPLFLPEAMPANSSSTGAAGTAGSQSDFMSVVEAQTGNGKAAR